jgi:hypothetical protein
MTQVRHGILTPKAVEARLERPWAKKEMEMKIFHMPFAQMRADLHKLHRRGGSAFFGAWGSSLIAL